MAKFADHMDKIAEGVTEGYQKIEDGVVGGYKKIEDGVVSGMKKIEDAFVNTFMTKEGESVEEAKARIADAQQARKEQMRTDAEKRAADQQAVIDASLEAARNAGKNHR